MYAIIRTGGKQYRVSENSVITVEKLEGSDGDAIELTDVLLIGDGDRVSIGSPRVEGAKVTATILSTEKGKKIKGYTFKKVKGWQRHYGHRQWQTKLRVDSIQAG